jgi:hypothetical protein
LFGQELQNGIQEFRIAWVGHFGFELAVFVDTPTGNQLGPPSTSFSRAPRCHPFGGRLRSARYARHRSASPRRDGSAKTKGILQKDFYTPRRASGIRNVTVRNGQRYYFRTSSISRLHNDSKFRSGAGYSYQMEYSGKLCGQNSITPKRRLSRKPRDRRIPEFL